MELDPVTLAIADRYKVLIGAIVPRPNLAPFSFFTAVGSNPMLLMFCPANNPDGSEKDTLRNAKPVEEGGQGECVIHVVPAGIGRRMTMCAEALPPGESEWDLCGLTPVPSVTVKPSRVAECPVAFECRTERVIRTNPGQAGGGNILIARVMHIFVRDDLINAKHHIDAAALDALGRMGGLEYCTTRERLTLPMGR